MFGSNLETALFLALVVMAVIEYLKNPLVKVKFVVAFLVNIRLAYMDGEHVVIWIIPYVAFIFGLLLSYMFNVDLVLDIIPGASPLASRLLTAVIIGCGSNVIHDVMGGRRITTMTPLTSGWATVSGHTEEHETCVEDCCLPMSSEIRVGGAIVPPRTR